VTERRRRHADIPSALAATAEGVADELELAVVASLNAGAMRMEVDLLLRAWEAAHRAMGEDVTAELL
jgi:hypothetical protein